MSSDRRVICQSCGNHESAVGPISWRGNCSPCGIERANQAAMELHTKRGPIYRRWKRNLQAGLDRQPLDAPQVRA
jgi:hypothetical protein